MDLSPFNLVSYCNHFHLENNVVRAKDCVGAKKTENEVQEHNFMSLRDAFNQSQIIVPEIPQYDDLLLYPNVK